MSLSRLPLSYCTNVHPGRTVAEVVEGLDRFSRPIKAKYGSELATGLWLASSVVREFGTSVDILRRFADGLKSRGLTCYTLNAFPYGDFHDTRVKENVYLPDWADSTRLEYTRACARCLAEFLPEGGEGSISTVPLGFKLFDRPENFMDRCLDQLIQLARQLDQLYSETGKMIRLAIEPEPFCILETTAETLQFFTRLRQRASDERALEVVRTHLGVCYDVCHQAIEFEDVAASIRSLASADIRINKVHITCALQIDFPSQNNASRAALARFVEPRYLHQTLALTDSGKILKHRDLDQNFIASPPAEFRDAPVWRVHFHMPVDAETVGPLKTTRHELKVALATIPELNYPPHLEVETYTWPLLPQESAPNIVEGVARELLATSKLLSKE